MNRDLRNDRADSTVWLPLLAILGGIAVRVTRRADEETATGPSAPAERGRQR